MKYRIHVILLAIKGEGTPEEKTDILQEEELVGYRDDFPDLESAAKVYEAFTGVVLDPAKG